jgi:hypothetical protein
MLKMIKTINLKLIILQFVSMVFLIHGIKRLHAATQGNIYEAIIDQDFDKFDSLTNISLSQYIVNLELWSLWSFIISIILIGIGNWKFKITLINSILTVLITSLLYLFGFFNKGIIDRNLNYFCGLFADGYGMGYFIGGAILTLMGLAFLWISFPIQRLHSTQQRV